jgi:arginine-tRNA-protein transferase
MNSNYQLGITQSFDCNYLPEQQERLLVATDQRLQNTTHYAWLMSQGFRRSGEQIYRPYCEHCSACQSVRVITAEFTASKSQKRLLKKNSHFNYYVSDQIKPSYYPLYENYINQIHKDGAMFPASKQQFMSFLGRNLTEQIFIETWSNDTLIAVAITDMLADALSAVYTFYDPLERKSGLGVYSILKQIELAAKMRKPYLYLGYQIDQCKKMNYKNRYFPYQRLIENSWKTINK